MPISPGVLTKHKLWGTLSQIQASLNISDIQISQILNITTDQYQARREKGSDLPAMSLFHLADELALNFEDLIQQNFDFDILKKNYCQDLTTLPANYTRCAFSRIFTLNNILNQAEVHGKAQEVLRAIQLNRSHLSNEYASISIAVIEKAINKASRYFNQDDYDEMGERNIMKNKDNFFGQELRKTTYYQELYEVLFERLSIFVEKNFIYKIEKSTPDHIIVNWLPNPELVEEFKTMHFTTQIMTKFRQAVIEAAALYIGKQKATLINIKSMDHGDLHYQWRVDFPRKFRFQHLSVSTA